MNLTKIAKIAAMGLLAAVSWGINWFLLKQSIYHGESLTFFGWPLLATVLGITFLAFFFLINNNRIASLSLDTLILLSYIVIFPKEFFPILAGAIFLVFLVLFEQRLLADGKSRLDFSIRRVMGSSVSLAVYSLLLLIGFNIYYNTQADFKAQPDIYYGKLEQAASKAAEKTVPYVTQDFNDQLSEEQKQELREMIAQQAVEKIKSSATQYQRFFPLVFTLIIVGLLSTFSFLLRWVTIISSWLIFHLLVVLKFFKLEPEMVEVKKLSV